MVSHPAHLDLLPLHHEAVSLGEEYLVEEDDTE